MNRRNLLKCFTVKGSLVNRYTKVKENKVYRIGYLTDWFEMIWNSMQKDVKAVENLHFNEKSHSIEWL